jgi:hypothetical protein
MIKHRHKLEGQRFAKLVVLSRAGDVNGKYPAWNCQCDCGNVLVVLSNNLLKGTSKSCGCFRDAKKRITKHHFDLLGQRFGKWLVVEHDPSKKKIAYWFCECECGCSRSVNSMSLRRGLTKSCGQRGCRIGRYSLGTSAKHHVLRGYVWNAKNKGLVWKLTDEDFYILNKQNCHYCGIPPNTVRKADGTKYTYNGVDRVDNTKGYIEGNIVPCCKVCNSAKNTMTVEEFYAWVERVWQKRATQTAAAV